MTSIPAKYESFLVMNAPTIGTIESSLRSLTWFLPGRFKDAEIVGEARKSMINQRHRLITIIINTCLLQ